MSHPEGTLILAGAAHRPVLARVDHEGRVVSYDVNRRVPPRGRRVIAAPGEMTGPEEAKTWVIACGGTVSRYLVHTAWNRFLRVLAESDAPAEVLDEDGLPYDGSPRAETLIRLRAPLPEREVERWQIFDPFSRTFEPVGVPADADAVALFHEQLTRELLIPGPVLVALEGLPDSSTGRVRAVSPGARRLARALLGAYGHRRRGPVVELLGADLGSWPAHVDRRAIHLVVLDPSRTSMRDAAARLRATHMRWGCLLREHAPSDNQGWSDWLRLLSGRPATGGAPEPSTDHALVTASLAQYRQAEVVAACRSPEARAGGQESDEHLACKAAIFAALSATYDGHAEVEYRPSDLDDEDDERPGEEDLRLDVNARIDLVAGPGGRHTLAVEVETCRGTIGQDPFSAVLRRLVHKQDALKRFAEVELVAPPSLAALAPRPFHRMAASLAERLGRKLIVATVDLGDGRRLRLDAKPPPATIDAPIRAVDTYAESTRTEETPLTWADIAGYRGVVDLIQSDVLAAFERADALRARGLGLPSGILLFGPPGTGKTRMARALAHALGHQVRLLRPSDIISKWLGEGIERIREVADWAARERPSAVIIDELDAIAPSRTGSASIHQDTLAMVNELLTQLDRLRELPDVVVIATTNAMIRLDPAVMRAGRFDFKMPVGPPTPADREAILTHYLGKQDEHVAPVTLARWVEQTHLLSPADLSALVEQAGRRLVLRGNGRTFEALMDECLAARNAPDVESLRRFVDDLERYAGPVWKAQYAWVGEDPRLFEEEARARPRGRPLSA